METRCGWSKRHSAPLRVRNMPSSNRAHRACSLKIRLDKPRGSQVNPDSAAWLAGFTFSSDLSTPGAFETTPQGDSDAFISRFYSPPVRMSLDSLSASSTHFQLTGETGRTYQIEASDDFVTWTPLAIGAATGVDITGTLVHVEAQQQFILTGKHFFRGVLQP